MSPDPPAGETPLQSLNPGQALTQVNAQSVNPLAVALQTTPIGSSTAALALIPRGDIGSTLTWMFIETSPGSGVGQIKAAASPAEGQHAGLCMTSREDLRSIQLMQCQQKGDPWYKAQVWMWHGGQLKDSGDCKCMARAQLDNHLKPVSCPDVLLENKIIWSFGGEVMLLQPRASSGPWHTAPLVSQLCLYPAQPCM